MIPLSLLVCIATLAPPSRQVASDWYTHESQFYFVETNIPRERATFVGRLMDATGKEYDRRFQGFRGVIRQKQRVVVFADQKQYVERLVKITGEKSVEHTGGLFRPGDGLVYTFDGPGMESTLKHECFHQFSHIVIGGRLPSWADEGLAEYFAEGIFDDKSGELLLGAIPKFRAEFLKKAHADGGLLTIHQLLHLDNARWNDQIGSLGSIQYNQAWALCHFLINADGRKYRQIFEGYLRTIDHGLDADSAWKRAFGADTTSLQQLYDNYIRDLKPAGPLKD